MFGRVLLRLGRDAKSAPFLRWRAHFPAGRFLRPSTRRHVIVGTALSHRDKFAVDDDGLHTSDFGRRRRDFIALHIFAMFFAYRRRDRLK